MCSMGMLWLLWDYRGYMTYAVFDSKTLRGLSLTTEGQSCNITLLCKNLLISTSSFQQAPASKSRANT